MAEPLTVAKKDEGNKGSDRDISTFVYIVFVFSCRSYIYAQINIDWPN